MRSTCRKRILRQSTFNTNYTYHAGQKKLRQTKNVITEMAQLYKTFTFLSGARFAKYKYVCTIKFCFLTSYSSRLSEGEGVGVQSGVHSSLCSSQSLRCKGEGWSRWDGP